MNIKEQLVDECIDIIKRGDVKTEIKNMFRPIIGMLLKDIYPYIFISMLFIIICFLKTSRNSNENFYSKDKLTGITPDSPESCKDPNDPEEICKNFDTCCMESLADKNCFCKKTYYRVRF